MYVCIYVCIYINKNAKSSILLRADYSSRDQPTPHGKGVPGGTASDSAAGRIEAGGANRETPSAGHGAHPRSGACLPACLPGQGLLGWEEGPR